MEGFEDPFNRRTFPWGREDQALLDWYRALGRARKELAPLRRGELAWERAEGGCSPSAAGGRGRRRWPPSTPGGRPRRWRCPGPPGTG